MARLNEYYMNTTVVYYSLYNQSLEGFPSRPVQNTYPVANCIVVSAHWVEGAHHLPTQAEVVGRATQMAANVSARVAKAEERELHHADN